MDLANVLAGLYPSESDGRRVAEDAGLDGGRVDFDGSALSMWTSVLREARREGDAMMGSVLAIAVKEYPENESLREAIGGLASRMSMAGRGPRLSDMGERDDETRDLLRSIRDEVVGVRGELARFREEANNRLFALDFRVKALEKVMNGPLDARIDARVRAELERILKGRPAAAAAESARPVLDWRQLGLALLFAVVIMVLTMALGRVL